MATNKPVGDHARKGAVKKRSQLATKTMGKKTFTKAEQERRPVHGPEKEDQVQRRAQREVTRLGQILPSGDLQRRDYRRGQEGKHGCAALLKPLSFNRRDGGHFKVRVVYSAGLASLLLILCRMRQRAFVLEHLARSRQSIQPPQATQRMKCSVSS